MGDHTIKAANIHVAKNKQKILILLYSSKTHDVDKPPQKIKITANSNETYHHSNKYRLAHRNFCPFALVRRYLAI